MPASLLWPTGGVIRALRSLTLATRIPSTRFSTPSYPPLGSRTFGDRGNRLMWFVFQGSIIFAVVASNIHWQWTPNGYLASLIGVGLAYGVTALLNALRLKYHRYRP